MRRSPLTSKKNRLTSDLGYIILACMLVDSMLLLYDRSSYQLVFRSLFVLPKMAALRKDVRATISTLRTFFAILAFADITHVSHLKVWQV